MHSGSEAFLYFFFHLIYPSYSGGLCMSHPGPDCSFCACMCAHVCIVSWLFLTLQITDLDKSFLRIVWFGRLKGFRSSAHHFFFLNVKASDETSSSTICRFKKTGRQKQWCWRTEMPTSQVFQGPLFSPITSIDGPNPETSNHALRCRILSGSTMAPSIPVIPHILQSSMALCSSSGCACGPLKGPV